MIRKLEWPLGKLKYRSGSRLCKNIKFKSGASFSFRERLLAGQDHFDFFDDFSLAQGVAFEGEMGDGFIEAVQSMFHVRQTLAWKLDRSTCRGKSNE